MKMHENAWKCAHFRKTLSRQANFLVLQICDSNLTHHEVWWIAKIAGRPAKSRRKFCCSKPMKFSCQSLQKAKYSFLWLYFTLNLQQMFSLVLLSILLISYLIMDMLFKYLPVYNINTRMPFSQRPTSYLPIESQTLTIWPWNELVLRWPWLYTCETKLNWYLGNQISIVQYMTLTLWPCYSNFT